MDEALLRTLTPTVIGILVRRGADFASAEDAVQDALVEAVRVWPDDPPRDPKGWLVTVAWRKFLDAARADASRRGRELAVQVEPPAGPVPATDDTLWLYFLCAHPSLSLGSAVALTLRAVGGLTTRQIATAYLVPGALDSDVVDPLQEEVDALAALDAAAAAARDFLLGLHGSPAAPAGMEEAAAAFATESLPFSGVGARAAVAELVEHGLPAATRSAGGRFFHFVTGGGTPAALAADWLASAIDQNSFSWVSSPLGSRVERVVLGWLKELFELPAEWGGVLTTGATMANFTALAAARRWWASEHGHDIDEEGWSGLPVMPVISSGYVHSSAVKALAMLGVGRASITRLAADSSGCLDVRALKVTLEALGGRPALILATAGDVNTGEFDPIADMVELAHRHRAWLHVDGAFGLFARVSTAVRRLADGVESADSVIADGHKWLNVPYECGFAFVRDPELMHGTFALTGAPYLPVGTDERPSFGDRGPEASRRARALTVWATLKAYGREGYREMVDRHIELARRVGDQVGAAPDLELLAPVRLNVICFRFRPPGVAEEELDELNQRLGRAILAEGRVYFGTTRYRSRVAFRPAICNWRTTPEDVDLIVAVTRELGARLLARA